jgi:hypothetical protein
MEVIVSVMRTHCLTLDHLGAQILQILAHSLVVDSKASDCCAQLSRAFHRTTVSVQLAKFLKISARKEFF